LLTRLIIDNLALVDNLKINFNPGLTVLTGETGAGKSVIIGGLALTLGERADRDHIRHGTSRAAVESTFDLSDCRDLRKNFKASLEDWPVESIILRREISHSGASKSTINRSPAILNDIRRISSVLIDLHSQQGHRRLLEPEQHLRFLDHFAGLTERVEKLEEIFRDLNSLDKQLNDARLNAEAVREKLELVNFQIDELSKADIRIGEEKELEEEQRKLESVRTLMEAGQTAIMALSEDENAVTAILAQIEKQLLQAAEIDRELQPEAALLSESLINLNELTRNLESYLSRLEDNPERLEEINARLSELYRLKKKYGSDEGGLVDKLEELKKHSLGAQDYDAHIDNLNKKLSEASGKYLELALEVSSKRRKAAPRLEKALVRELTDLAIDKPRFEIEFQTEADENGFEVNGEKLTAYPHGLENIEFLISTNPNEPVKPLIKIASGGEISRIMLALLTVIAGKYRRPTIIFDEIDTGIGGVTAVKLGEKLKELSRKHQVIVISHLPAIASRADHHLAVSKSLKDGRNIIEVREVKGKELERELSRMTGWQ